MRDVMLSRLHIHDVGAGGVSVEKPADYEDGSAVRNLSLVDSRIHVSESVTCLKRFVKPLDISLSDSVTAIERVPGCPRCCCGVTTRRDGAVAMSSLARAGGGCQQHHVNVLDSVRARVLA